MRRSSAVKQIFVSEDEGVGRKKKDKRKKRLIIFPRERK